MPTCPICGNTDTSPSTAEEDAGSFECQNDDCRAKFDPTIVVRVQEAPPSP